jgi:SAM-dependent methyltransferase
VSEPSPDKQSRANGQGAEATNGPAAAGVARLREDVDAFLRRREIADVQRLIGREIDIRIGLSQATTLTAIRRRDQQTRSLAEALRQSHAQLQQFQQGFQQGLQEAHSQLAQLISTLQRLESASAEAGRLVVESRALPYMDGPPLDQFEHPVAGTVSGFTDQADSAGTDGYRTFEDRFRGSEDFIRERQRVYLDLIAEGSPVVDAGCGRGEFLDLLKDAGVEYTGVDLDASMIERCRSKGHESVREADVTDYLRGLDDGSLGTVFSAQLVEHLPFEQLRSFLELARAKLRSGGVFIAETVNPHSAQALKTFWVDPTHEHPLFPEVMLELCRISGFTSAFVFHPNGSGDVDADRFDQGEYAVVATAP